MKQVKTCLILSFLVIGLIFQLPAKAQFEVPRSVLGNGGGLLTGTNNRLAGTLGQPLTGIASNPGNTLTSGFWQMTANAATDFEEVPNNLKTGFRLDQNFPNPFNHKTTIGFELPRRSSVVLKLFDLHGREVATMVDAELPPGEHRVEFNATGISGGIYFYRLETVGFVQSRKLTLVE